MRRVQGRGAAASFFVIDACRDNPFEQVGVRSIGSTRGLARIDAPTGVFVLFSAGIGQTALDRLDAADRSPNSVFTRTLVPLLGEPGLSHLMLAKRVQTDVKALAAKVGHPQQPAFYDQIDGEVFFRTAHAVPGASPPAGPPPAAISPADAKSPDDRKAPPAAASQPHAPVSKVEVLKLFAPLAQVIDKVQKDFVEKPDDRMLFLGAVEALAKAAPARSVAVAGTPPAPSRRYGSLDDFYEAAVGIINDSAAGDDARMVESTINGMLASLDPHSNFLGAGAYRDMQVQTKGQFGGLGIEVTMADGLVKVVTPIEDTPAARAGVLAADLITHIDDQPVEGLALNQAVERMRGPVGSKVRVRITRQNVDKPIELVITRETIRVRAVRANPEGNDVGYIRITQFNEQTTDLLKTAIAGLQQNLDRKKLKGFVLDLRSNPGGLLAQAISVADLFLDKGEIVSLRGRNAPDNKTYNAKPGDLLKGAPIVVLINGGTAAGSEILAAALRDNNRATVLGSRSFGKGSVQTILPLGPGAGALRLTTARFFTPAGRSIQASGVSPDIEVLQDIPADQKAKAAASPEQTGLQSFIPPDRKDDRAFQRAIAMLRSKRWGGGWSGGRIGFPPPIQPRRIKMSLRSH